MIAITTSGARLVRDADDWRMLNTLAVAIANAVATSRGLDIAFDDWTGASALSYLRELDPPQGDRDVVVWAWTDTPAASRHVTLPAVEAPAPKQVGRASNGRFTPAA